MAIAIAANARRENTRDEKSMDSKLSAYTILLRADDDTKAKIARLIHIDLSHLTRLKGAYGRVARQVEAAYEMSCDPESPLFGLITLKEGNGLASQHGLG